VQVPTLDIIFTERNIIGNIVGTYNDLAEPMALAEGGRVTPRTRTYPLKAAADAFADLDAGRVRGRAIPVPQRAGPGAPARSAAGPRGAVAGMNGRPRGNAEVIE
jgi:hypothetical protein